MRLIRIDSRVAWNALGILWKDFSPIFPYLRLITGWKVARLQFHAVMPCVFSSLTEFLFKNLSVDPARLWKADCDYSNDRLRVVMGSLWR